MFEILFPFLPIVDEHGAGARSCLYFKLGRKTFDEYNTHPENSRIANSHKHILRISQANLPSQAAFNYQRTTFDSKKQFSQTK